LEADVGYSDSGLGVAGSDEVQYDQEVVALILLVFQWVVFKMDFICQVFRFSQFAFKRCIFQVVDNLLNIPTGFTGIGGV